jgi:hypothetical protein
MVFIIDSILIAIITTALILLPLSCKKCEPKVNHSRIRKRGIRIRVKKCIRRDKNSNIEKISLINNSNIECSICLDNIEDTDVKKLVCNHCFHIDCIDQWFLRETTCPMCRIEIINHQR